MPATMTSLTLSWASKLNPHVRAKVSAKASILVSKAILSVWVYFIDRQMLNRANNNRISLTKTETETISWNSYNYWRLNMRLHERQICVCFKNKFIITFFLITIRKKADLIYKRHIHPSYTASDLAPFKGKWVC